MRLLLSSYKQSRKGLRKMLRELDKEEKEIKAKLIEAESDSDLLEQLNRRLGLINYDKGLINSMIDSTSDIIKWIETGVNPYYQSGVDRRYNYDVTNLSNMDIIPDITKQLKSEREELRRLSKEEIRTITKVLNALTERERECFLLHVAAGHSMNETGKILGIAKTTVQNHIEKSRKKIKRIVSKN